MDLRETLQEIVEKGQLAQVYHARIEAPGPESGIYAERLRGLLASIQELAAGLGESSPAPPRDPFLP